MDESDWILEFLTDSSTTGQLLENLEGRKVTAPPELEFFDDYGRPRHLFHAEGRTVSPVDGVRLTIFDRNSEAPSNIAGDWGVVRIRKTD